MPLSRGREAKLAVKKGGQPGTPQGSGRGSGRAGLVERALLAGNAIE